LKSALKAEGDEFIGKTEFFNKINEWCKENRFRNISERTISKKMKEMNIFDGMEDYYTPNNLRKQFRVWKNINWIENTEKVK
jgi:hypothetical protein